MEFDVLPGSKLQDHANAAMSRLGNSPTKGKTVSKSATLEPEPPKINLPAHQADLARRQAERDAKHDEMLKCIVPSYAKAREYEKPLYEFSVSVKFLDGEVDERTGKVSRLFKEYEDEIVIGRDENVAWARFCDKCEVTVGRRDWKPTITQIRKLTDKEARAFRDADAVPGGDADGPIPTIAMSSKRKAKKK